MCAQRTMVPRREKPSYQSSGAPSRLIRSACLHKGQERLAFHLQMDNNIACFYVRKMGSPKLSEQACRLWQWCLQRNITLSAEYLPGTNNWIADRESHQVQTSAEWKSVQECVLIPCTMPGGFVCLTAEPSAREIRELEPNTRSY